MNIALVNNYWYLRGGAERVVFDTKALLEAQGHAVSCFGMYHKKNVVDQTGFAPNNEAPPLVYAKTACIHKKAVAAFASFLETHQPDVVHIHNIYHHLTFAILDEAKKRAIPVVMTAHDYKLISPNYTLFHHGKPDMNLTTASFGYCLRKNCLESWPRSYIASKEFSMRKTRGWNDIAQKIIVPSDFMYRQCIHAGIDASRLVHVSNPVRQSADKSGQVETKSGILFVGRLEDVKGIDEFLALVRQRPEYSFAVIGDGKARDRVEHQADLCHNLTLLDWQKPAAVKRHMQQASFLVVPSQWPEPFGLTVAEAVLAGTIPLVTPVGALPELVAKTCVAKTSQSSDLARLLDQWMMADTQTYRDTIQVMQSQIQTLTNPLTYVAKIEELYADVLSM